MAISANASTSKEHSRPSWFICSFSSPTRTIPKIVGGGGLIFIYPAYARYPFYD